VVSLVHAAGLYSMQSCRAGQIREERAGEENHLDVLHRYCRLVLAQVLDPATAEEIVRMIAGIIP
jgi:hypothetical protein